MFVDEEQLFARNRDLESTSTNHQYTVQEREILGQFEAVDYLPPHSQAYKKWLSGQPSRYVIFSQDTTPSRYEIFSQNTAPARYEIFLNRLHLREIQHKKCSRKTAVPVVHYEDPHANDLSFSAGTNVASTYNNKSQNYPA